MNEVLKKYRQLVDSINLEYATLCSLSNDELRRRLNKIEIAINDHENRDKALEDYLVPVFAIVKETARRFSEGNIEVIANPNDIRLANEYDFVEIIGSRAVYKNHWDVMGVPHIWKMVHYDEQLLGGILLHYGYATEMATGEGKTLMATLPVFLNALTHNGVHLMTVNDYLSKRDYETTRPLYMFFGLTADCIERYPRTNSRYKEAYKMDIVFGTNSSFTFDYLFDHLAINPHECVQTTYNYAIIDEIDSILIDEAGTPHIVSGGNQHDNKQIYKENYPIVEELIRHVGTELFECNRLKMQAEYTSEGKKWIAEKKGIPDLYEVERTYEVADFEKLAEEKQLEIRGKLYLQNVFQQLLLALTVYERDVDYIVDADKVIIIDPHTGRAKKTHRWGHGLHTALEIKEKVEVQKEFNSMAVISLKNFFKLYTKVAGMSGTIMPVEEELSEIYNLKCASLPTHKPIIRQDKPLRIFKNKAAKDDAIIRAVIDNRNMGRPTLVGCITVKRSEEICAKMDELGIEYNKLDAKTIKDEAFTISKAGYGRTITIATSVAGRGTDIKPSEDALNAGGLMVIGTDLFESVRVDRQLKGRSGRQGDPGTSVFFASLDDQILKNLTTEDFQSLETLISGVPDGEIDDDKIREFFVKAQANREAYFKSCRKETAMKDDIVAPQRKKFYEQRNAVLFNADTAISIVSEIILQSNSTEDSIYENLKSLYSTTKELFIRSAKNNPNRTTAHVPFSYKRHIFAILLDIEPTIASFDYFCKEFKRQIILQVYDKEWKKFVLYIMSNLDSREIELLDGKYLKMMKEINSSILSHLQFSTIPFDERSGVINQDRLIYEKYDNHLTPSTTIKLDDNCPCGSGKKFCECHGRNIRSNKRNKRRR